MQPDQQLLTELTLPNNAGPGSQRITINKGNNGAILGYDSAGRLVFSIAVVAGVDSFGNHYLAGYTAYDRGNNIYTNVFGGDVSFGQLIAGAPDTTSISVIQQFISLPGYLNINSGVNALGPLYPSSVTFAMLAGLSSVTTGNPQAPQINIFDPPPASGTQSEVDITLAGSLIRTDPTGFLDSWTAPAYHTGWTGGTSFNGLGGHALQLRRTCEDEIKFDGIAQVTGVTTSVMVLPPLLRPASTNTPHGHVNRLRSGTEATIEFAVVGSSGLVVISQAPVVGDFYSFCCDVPMGHLA